jgi:hypothetical protein
VPADYFRKAQHPSGAGMLPASPPFRKKKPVLAAVIGSLVAVSVVITAVVVWTSSKAAQNHVDPGAATAVALPDPSTATTATPATDQKIAVFVSVDPSDAQIGPPEGKMQTGPVTVTLGANEETKLKIEKKGYVTQIVTLKASEVDPKAAWRVYSLKPLPGTTPVKPPAGRPPVVKPPTSALPPPIVKPPPPPSGACEPPRFRDPFDGKCH